MVYLNGVYRRQRDEMKEQVALVVTKEERSSPSLGCRKNPPPMSVIL